MMGFEDDFVRRNSGEVKLGILKIYVVLGMGWLGEFLLEEV